MESNGCLDDIITTDSSSSSDSCPDYTNRKADLETISSKEDVLLSSETPEPKEKLEMPAVASNDSKLHNSSDIRIDTASQKCLNISNVAEPINVSDESNSQERTDQQEVIDLCENTHDSSCIDYSTKPKTDSCLPALEVTEDSEEPRSYLKNNENDKMTSSDISKKSANIDGIGNQIVQCDSSQSSSEDMKCDEKKQLVSYDEGGMQCEAIDFSTSSVSKCEEDSKKVSDDTSDETHLEGSESLSRDSPIRKQNDESLTTAEDVNADDLETKMDIATNNCETSVDTEANTSKSEKGDCVEVDESSEMSEETGFPDIFKGHVKIGKYVSVKGDFTLKSSKALIESPSLVAPFLLKEADTFPGKKEEEKYEVKDFFKSSVGEFLLGLGLSRINEWCQRDIMLKRLKQAKKEGKSESLDQEIEKHKFAYMEAKKANEPFSFPYKKCDFCGFTTESAIVFESHLLSPHVTRFREYVCNYCSYLHRDPKDMLKHMKNCHDKTGYIQSSSVWLDCPFCTFETTSKAKLNNHALKCLKCYKPEMNQAPPRDLEHPCLTPKPITVAVVKAFEKSLNSSQKNKRTSKKFEGAQDFIHPNLQAGQRPYKPFPTPSPEGFIHNQPSFTGASKSIFPNANVMNNSSPLGQSGNQYYQALNSGGMHSNPPISSIPSFYMNANNQNKANYGRLGSSQQPIGRDVPELPPGMLQLPRLQGPYPGQVNKNMPSYNSQYHPASLVVCEICDGYIKDMEQLRTHMQLIHKVKIHPKMLVSRPPLNCQKCQWRFFTDQGLERHLLGAHGLVTSNMQELSSRGRDSGCCTICGRIFATKLVAHMTQSHKITLKPAHLSYKCTVCSATFGLYRLFENHVYLVHSGAVKRPVGSNSDMSSSCKRSMKSGVMGDREGYIPEKENEIS